MADLSELKARLEALKRALACGAQSVEFLSGGVTRRLTYRSIDQLKAAIAVVEQDIAKLTGASVVRRFLFTSDKAL